jgi:hypothetical protein
MSSHAIPMIIFNAARSISSEVSDTRWSEVDHLIERSGRRNGVVSARYATSEVLETLLRDMLCSKRRSHEPRELVWNNRPHAKKITNSLAFGVTPVLAFLALIIYVGARLTNDWLTIWSAITAIGAFLALAALFVAAFYSREQMEWSSFALQRVCVCRTARNTTSRAAFARSRASSTLASKDAPMWTPDLPVPLAAQRSPIMRRL